MDRLNGIDRNHPLASGKRHRRFLRPLEMGSDYTRPAVDDETLQTFFHTKSRTPDFVRRVKIFFHFLQEKYPDIEESDLKNWPVTVLDKVTLTQLEEYLDYLRLYEDAENKVHTNEERGRMRKTASIRTFYKFFYRKQVIKNNTASLLNLPKKHEHTIVRLEIDEIAKLLDAVEEGDNLTKSQKKYQVNIFVILGKKTESLTELKKEYTELKDQLDYQFFVSKSMVLVHDEDYFLKNP